MALFLLYECMVGVPSTTYGRVWTPKHHMSEPLLLGVTEIAERGLQCVYSYFIHIAICELRLLILKANILTTLSTPPKD